MPDTIRGKRTDGKVLITADTALIDAGDLLFYDATTNEAHPASNQADQLTEPLNQQLFAQLFLGVSEDRSPSGTTTAITVNVNPLTEYEFACSSQTWGLGDLVGAVEIGAGTGLEDQTLTSVSDIAEAIGVCVQQETAATTLVRVRLFSRLLGELGLTSGAAGPQVGVNVQTLAATLTLTTNSPRYQLLDPGGAARTVTLPAEAEGLVFTIVNTADGDEILTINNDAGGLQMAIERFGRATIISDGTSWFALSSAQQTNEVNVETLAADKTGALTDPMTQLLDPGGADRNYNLNAEEAAVGMGVLRVFNTADADETITIREDAGLATIKELRQGEYVHLVTSGAAATWFILAEGFGNAPPLSAHTEGAAWTLADDDVPVHRITTSVASVLTLPAEAATNRPFLIAHVSGAHVLRVDNDAAGVIITDIANGETGKVWSDGTNWYGETFQIT